MKKLLFSLGLSLLLGLALGALLSLAAPDATMRTVNSGHHFLPPYPNPRDRFGFDSNTSDPLTNYDVTRLHAGWYSDWAAGATPAHTDRLTYVQLLRFTAGGDPLDPTLVKLNPSRATIAQIAAAHPGSLWMINNEPDSLYQGNPIYPQTYAHVYHELYYYIKGLDPTALIANGGIVQPTPCRMQYLDIVLDTYRQAYGEPMPVDVWNIHAFTLREVYGSWGASTPPGVPTSCAIDYKIRDADNMTIFRNNLIAFRQWMKEKGEQNKPLIISEYGILWPEWLSDEDGRKYTPARVSYFMTRTFDLFLYETYPDVGYPADDYRLVQAWAWYSLSDQSQYNGYLFYPSTRNISPMGQAYSNYTAALSDTLYTDLSARLTVDVTPLQSLTFTAPSTVISAALPVQGFVANLGKTPADNVVVAVPELGFQTVQNFPARYEGNIGSLPLPSFVLTRSGVYTLTLIADPAQAIADARRWNNRAVAVVDARPDLVISDTVWGIESPGVSGGLLRVTMTVANRELLATPPLSGAVWLTNSQGTLIPGQHFAIPPIKTGGRVVVTQVWPLPDPAGDLYHLIVEVDPANALSEKVEGNNRMEVEIDARPDLTVTAAATMVNPQGGMDGAYTATITVTNGGLWPSFPVSGLISLSGGSGTLLLYTQPFSVPAVARGVPVTIVQSGTLPAVGVDLYHLSIEVDSDHILRERDEGNNGIHLRLPVVVTTTLQPGVSATLRSASGRLQLDFPADAVTETTEVRLIPLWWPDLPPGPLHGVEAFRLVAYRGGIIVSPTLPSPITVTFRYSDADLDGGAEETLGLYRLTEGNIWRRTAHPAEARNPEENWMRAYLPQWGTYAFGVRYAAYLPAVMRSSTVR